MDRNSVIRNMILCGRSVKKREDLTGMSMTRQRLWQEVLRMTYEEKKEKFYDKMREYTRQDLCIAF